MLLFRAHLSAKICYCILVVSFLIARCEHQSKTMYIDYLQCRLYLVTQKDVCNPELLIKCMHINTQWYNLCTYMYIWCAAV